MIIPREKKRILFYWIELASSRFKVFLYNKGSNPNKLSLPSAALYTIVWRSLDVTAVTNWMKQWPVLYHEVPGIIIEMWNQWGETQSNNTHDAKRCSWLSLSTSTNNLMMGSKSKMLTLPTLIRRFSSWRHFTLGLNQITLIYDHHHHTYKRP